MSQPLQLLHEIDPKQEIIDESAALVAPFHIRPYDVMTIVYERDLTRGVKKLRSGIFLSDNGKDTLREDGWQGKVGLVMKVGSLAFSSGNCSKCNGTGEWRTERCTSCNGTGEDHRWDGFTPKVGDWVVINIGDTFGFHLPKLLHQPRGRKVRIVDENLVRAIVPEPDVVW